MQIKGYEAALERSLPRKHQATPQDSFGHRDFLQESWPEVIPTFGYLLTSFLLLLHFEALKKMLLLLCLIPCVCMCPGVFVPVNVLPAEARKDCWS